jgi:hypothetical protein
VEGSERDSIGRAVVEGGEGEEAVKPICVDIL